MNAHVIHSRQFCRLPKRPEKFRLGLFKEIRAYNKYSGLEVGRMDANPCLRQLGERSNQMSFYLSILFLSLYPFIVVQLHQSKLNRFPTGSCYFQKWLKQKKRKWFRNTCCRDGKTITLDAFYFNKSANGAFTFGNGLALRLNRNISSSIVLYFV